MCWHNEDKTRMIFCFSNQSPAVLLKDRFIIQCEILKWLFASKSAGVFELAPVILFGEKVSFFFPTESSTHQRTPRSRDYLIYSSINCRQSKQSSRTRINRDIFWDVLRRLLVFDEPGKHCGLFIHFVRHCVWKSSCLRVVHQRSIQTTANFTELLYRQPCRVWPCYGLLCRDVTGCDVLGK